ncbi:MAG: insulinase family protein [Deltaproteobacteria bacterium]|nr:MAG: insulinase family protein [Deltaproteobacteria bacterium]
MRHTLPNGLTLLVEENHAAPVVAIQVWMRVGSADEGPDEAGIAHLHEHMLFKGTARRGPGDIARTVESCGGEINAWTSFDQTVYHVVLASRFFAEGMDVLADAVTSAAFDPVELQREIEVVCEEIKRSQDSPTRKLSRELFAASFARHPYGKPVIGTEESVRSFTREGILRFYRRWYKPANAVLVVVGDVREAEALELAEKSFRWPEDPFVAAPSRPPEPHRELPLARMRAEPLKEGYLSIAWPSPPLVHEDVAALDALAIVLGHGEASRLHRALKRDRLLCTDVQASCYTPVDPGLTIVGLTLQPATARDAVREALSQTYRLRSEEVMAEELSVACRLLESDAVYQRETVQGQARKLGFYQSSAGGVEFEQRYLDHVARLTPARVRDAAERWIDPSAAVLAALLPERGCPPEGEMLELLQEAAAVVRPRAAPSSAPPEKRAPIRFAERATTGPLLREELPSGGVLLIKEERAVPLVALRAAWQGGLRAEDGSNAGINMLLARLVSKGTQTRGPERLVREMEAMGGSIGGNAGRNSFGLRAELLSRHLREGFDIFAEAVSAPAFDPEEVQRERTLQIDELRSREDNPAGVAFLLFGETLYRKHPYRFDTLGTESSVARLEPGILSRYRAQQYPPGALTISVVGNVDPAEVREQVLRRFTSAPAARVPIAPVQEEPPDAPRFAVKKLDKAQAHLVLGFPGARLSDRARWPLEVLSAVLSGQGGRLFVELRDKRSLAYSVTSFSMEGLDPGYFAVYIGCGPGKVQEALDGIRNELRRIREQPIGAAELARARHHLIGTHAISLQRNSARAAVYAFDECYGLGADASAKYAANVAAVSAEDVLATAQSLLTPSREVIALVAPEGAVPQELGR